MDSDFLSGVLIGVGATALGIFAGPAVAVAAGAGAFTAALFTDDETNSKDNEIDRLHQVISEKDKQIKELNNKFEDYKSRYNPAAYIAQIELKLLIELSIRTSYGVNELKEIDVIKKTLPNLKCYKNITTTDMKLEIAKLRNVEGFNENLTHEALKSRAYSLLNAIYVDIKLGKTGADESKLRFIHEKLTDIVKGNCFYS